MEDERAARPTRRQVLAGALALGATAGAAAGGNLIAGAEPAQAAATAISDVDLLTPVLQAERLSIIAYRHVLGLADLTPHAHRVLRGLLAQDRAHLRVLTAELRALGAPLPPAPRTAAAVAQALSSHGMPGDLSSTQTVKDGLQLLLDIEAVVEGAYYTAIASLTADGPLVRAAQALANEAQHSAILSDLAHPGDVTQSVPYWYVEGIS